MKVECVVFDFAGTLCSEGYFKELPLKYYKQASDLIFADSPDKLSARWSAGELSSKDITDYLATQMPFTSDEILRALYQGCAHMTFNPAIWKFALRQKALGRKLALVTINMDVFTNVVVPAHKLHDTFDVIVNSADFHETRKAVLFQTAFDHLGADLYGFHNSLLIDDSERQIDVFRTLGGRAFHYVDDSSFKCSQLYQAMLDQVTEPNDCL